VALERLASADVLPLQCRPIHEPDLDSQPISNHAPRLFTLGRLAPASGDSLPVLEDVPLPMPQRDGTPRSGPPRGDDSSDDLSTGLFETVHIETDAQSRTLVTKQADLLHATQTQLDDITSDPLSSEQETRKPWEATDVRRPPSLSVVRSVAASIENEFQGMRAVPLEREPRPDAGEVVDWPPPAQRPVADLPRWTDEGPGDTRIVLDPVARPRRSRAWVAAVDAAAWLLGFVAMFLTGLVTTGSAALVLFAISIRP
jgi:hypothetical protein